MAKENGGKHLVDLRHGITSNTEIWMSCFFARREQKQLTSRSSRKNVRS